MDNAIRLDDEQSLGSGLVLAVGYSVLAGRLKALIWQHRRLSSIASKGLLILAGLIIAAGIAGSYSTWQDNQVLRAKAARAVTASNRHAKLTNNRAASLAPGSAPSTVTPSAAAYHVAPNLPRLLIIPALNVNARILSIGLNADHSIATPGNVFDTAWYNGSSLPGSPGAMLIDGHISSWTTPGVFYHLSSLRPGNAINVERGDGTTAEYHVVKVQVYDATAVDMSQILNPVITGRPGLNLISCYGSVIRGTNDFSQRVVVFASE